MNCKWRFTVGFFLGLVSGLLILLVAARAYLFN